MPLWILTAWRVLKPLMPYIGAVVALGIVYGVIAHIHYNHGYHSRDKEVATLIAQRDGYKANADTLTDALNRQNAAVDALRKEGDQRLSDGKKALSEAQRANQGLQDQAEALRRSAGRKVDATPCPISETLAKVGVI